MDLKAEVFFLIVKLLENEGCSSAAELIKKFIDEKKLLPERINTAGVSFHNTYDNYDSLHSLSSPSLLVEYYELLMKLVHDGKSCSSHAKTLMGIQSRMKKLFRAKRTEFSIGLREYNKSKKLLLNHLHRCSKLQFHILAHRTAIYCLEFDKRGKYVFTVELTEFLFYQLIDLVLVVYAVNKTKVAFTVSASSVIFKPYVSSCFATEWDGFRVTL
ncbi:unnamed protein product [Trichobilharzia szidati]|nr:unnamed protein product [Trichobilharzia szidati]